MSSPGPDTPPPARARCAARLRRPQPLPPQQRLPAVLQRALQDLDLGAWASESFRMPTEAPPDDAPLATHACNRPDRGPRVSGRRGLAEHRPLSAPAASQSSTGKAPGSTGATVRATAARPCAGPRASRTRPPGVHLAPVQAHQRMRVVMLGHLPGLGRADGHAQLLVSSRRSACSTLSPASSLPPGNSQ
jgi:hypothetical protein